MSRRTRSNPVTRRRFVCLAGGGVAWCAFGAACRATEAGPADDGYLTAKPRNGVKTTASAGTHPLGLADGRDAILQMPDEASLPLPLLVLLHGAGGSGAGILRRLGAAAAGAGIAVLAPDSRGSTWDAIRGRFGADVTFMDRALARVFDTVAVDPARVAVSGFSDGATYAVTLGLLNGDLFRRVLAFSPGFVVEGRPRGNARFFVSHGRSDRILPIDQCSRAIVPALERNGYRVTYKEFDGGHEVPAAIADEGMKWVASRP